MHKNGVPCQNSLVMSYSLRQLASCLIYSQP